MSQLVTRLSDELLTEVDKLVADGVVGSRSDAVRVGLLGLVDQHRRRSVGRRIVDAYRQRPQTQDELGGLDEATKALVFEESW